MATQLTNVAIGEETAPKTSLLKDEKTIPNKTTIPTVRAGILNHL